MIQVLFVCVGNICRSPAGEGIFRSYVEQMGLRDEVSCLSAGIVGSHSGEKPDPRMCRAASLRGYDLKSRARKFDPAAFDRYDRIIAMDEYVRDTLLKLAREDEHRNKISLMGKYHPDADAIDIPDPYYGRAEGFEHVLDLLEVACRKLLDDIVAKQKLNPAK